MQGVQPAFPPPDPLLDADYGGDYTDEELDAEMVEDEADGNTSISDKTVTVSVADGE
jgi:E3 ubiquitin-protein ligase TRIP12